jgi:peptide/nickel transport system ATP-binding protein
VLARPAHPYTAGLLASTPTPDVSRGVLPAIPGRPPAIEEHQQPGCAFAPRCGHALAACSQRTPPLLDGGAAGAVACPVVGAARMVAA